jgi:hypothetical protein
VRVPALIAEWTAVTFVIDTGSPYTLIHAAHAMAQFGSTPASLDSASWTDSATVEGIGGGFAYRVLPATFGFPTLDGALVLVEADVRLGEIRTANLPPLLGMDLLSRLRLTVDGARDSVELAHAQ